MKIVVLGTSNSVVGNKGYLQSLRLEHEVIQLSSGRVPFYYHIKEILTKRDLLESADLIILDHYVNDVNFYIEKNLKDYRKHLEQFYFLLSTLNTHILNVLFPIWRIAEGFGSEILQKTIEFSERYRIQYLNLNDVQFKYYHFLNDVHLNHNTSYALGLVLKKYIEELCSTNKPASGAVNSCPFVVLTPVDFNSGNAVETFSNSLLSLEYVDVRRTLTIKMSDSTRLISLGYLRPKTQRESSGLVINGVAYGMGEFGYFHECIDHECYGDIEIEPLIGKTAVVQNLMGRGKSKGEFGYCYLSDFVFYDEDQELEAQPATRDMFEIAFDTELLLFHVERLSPLIDDLPVVNFKMVKYFRDEALKIENENIQAAYLMMSLARRGNPSGTTISNRIRSYRRKLDLPVENL